MSYWWADVFLLKGVLQWAARSLSGLGGLYYGLRDNKLHNWSIPVCVGSFPSAECRNAENTIPVATSKVQVVVETK